MTEDYGVEEISPQPSSNRSFILVAVGMGGVLLLSVACLAAYLLFWVPRQREAQQAQQATEIAAAGLQETESAEQTEAALPEDTATLEPPTEEPTFTPSWTPTRTETPVIVQATATETVVAATPWGTAATWTVVAQQTGTALAVAQGGGETATPTSAATALPATGFVDSSSPVQLGLLALILAAVVIATRALRKRWVS